MSIDPAELTPIELTDGLRDSMTANLAAHDRIELPLDGRRHAAVAIVVVDSKVGDDHIDAFAFGDDDLSVIPGFESGADKKLDGRMAGVAGGASLPSKPPDCE